VKQQRNIVGPQVMKIRNDLQMSQTELAAKCQRQGWDVSRDIIAKIEGQVRWLPDFELHKLATALEVKIPDLFPKDQQQYF